MPFRTRKTEDGIEIIGEGGSRECRIEIRRNPDVRRNFWGAYFARYNHTKNLFHTQTEAKNAVKAYLSATYRVPAE